MSHRTDLGGVAESGRAGDWQSRLSTTTMTTTIVWSLSTQLNSLRSLFSRQSGFSIVSFVFSHIGCPTKQMIRGFSSCHFVFIRHYFLACPSVFPLQYFRRLVGWGRTFFGWSLLGGQFPVDQSRARGQKPRARMLRLFANYYMFSSTVQEFR